MTRAEEHLLKNVEGILVMMVVCPLVPLLVFLFKFLGVSDLIVYATFLIVIQSGERS